MDPPEDGREPVTPEQHLEAYDEATKGLAEQALQKAQFAARLMAEWLTLPGGPTAMWQRDGLEKRVKKLLEEAAEQWELAHPTDGVMEYSSGGLRRLPRLRQRQKR